MKTIQELKDEVDGLMLQIAKLEARATVSLKHLDYGFFNDDGRSRIFLRGTNNGIAAYALEGGSLVRAYPDANSNRENYTKTGNLEDK